MMKKKLIIIFFLIFLNTAHALTFTDNFSSYNNYYKILSTTCDISVLHADNINLNDTNTVNIDTNKPKFGSCGVHLNTINYIRDVNYADVLYDINGIDLSDYNASGRAYYWAKIQDGNIAMQRQFSFRIGTDTSQYNSFYNTDGYPWNEPFYQGYNLVQFDLNQGGTQSGGHGGTGWQDWTNEGFVETRTSYGYDGHPGDFNMTFNQLWFEKSTGATNGNWVPMYQGATLRPWGWARPNPEAGGIYSLLIAPTDRPAFGRNARIFYTQLNPPTIWSRDYNVTLNVDFKQVDANMTTAFIIDHNTVNNYNKVFVKNTGAGDANVGIESVVAGVRHYHDVNVAFSINEYHHLKFVTDNNNVSVFLDGIDVLDSNFDNRLIGQTAIDSNQGQTNIENYSIELTLGGQPTTTSSSSVISKYDYTATFDAYKNLVGAMVLTAFLVVIFIIVGIAYHLKNNPQTEYQSLISLDDIVLIGMAILFVIFIIFLSARVIPFGT